ncbi:MAG TPA: hypothetical protein VFU03_10630 [Gemmatimonadales bacterium]|nr:hypothetical protein [Gemmatimonadales bacterium]
MSLTLVLIGVAIPACRAKPRNPDEARTSAADTGFAGVQTRGQAVMGVDQYTSQHVFEDLPDGGRVVLERDDASDSAGIATIRSHMQDIARRFTTGDFALPGVVHAREVPGTDVMAARRDGITYTEVDRPRGAELRIVTEDSVAIAAIHQFLAFQRMDHHAAGHMP